MIHDLLRLSANASPVLMLLKIRCRFRLAPACGSAPVNTANINIKLLDQLIKYYKETLKLDSVSFILGQLHINIFLGQFNAIFPTAIYTCISFGANANLLTAMESILSQSAVLLRSASALSRFLSRGQAPAEILRLEIDDTLLMRNFVGEEPNLAEKTPETEAFAHAPTTRREMLSLSGFHG